MSYVVASFSGGKDSTAITAVGIREKARPDSTLVRNQCSLLNGKAWSILHMRLL